MIDLTTTVVSALIIAIACTLVAVAYAYKSRSDAYYKGRDDENQVTVEHFEALRTTMANLRHEATQHQQDIDTLKAKHKQRTDELNARIPPLLNERTELQQEVDRLNRAIALLQAAPPFPEYINVRDVERINEMVEKLRIAAPALHAAQNFRAAKETERLAHTGQMMADKFSTVLQAQQQASDQPQDAPA